MQIIRVYETSSTNNYASSFIAENKVDEGTVFHTYRQLQGRGQGENRWESEHDSNLTFSLVLHPGFLTPADQFLISQAVSLGIADFLGRMVAEVSVKWPNDLLIAKRKVAGVLMEHTIAGNSLLHTIVGIGVNINQTHFAPFKPEATSLALTTGCAYDTEVLLPELYEALMNRYSQLQAGDVHGIENDYLSKLYGFEQSNRFSANERIFEGKIRGIDRFGHLLVEEKSGTINQWQFKEITLLWD